MKKKSIILSTLLLCLLGKVACLAQDRAPSYNLDNIMREILDTRMDVLDDTLYFNQQMQYYKQLYDILNDSVRLDMLENSTKIWYNAGYINEKDSIRGNELNFYIKISLYFQYFYAEEQKRKHIEKWEKEIGDSLHLIFNVDGEKIPNSKYQLYGVSISKDNHQRKVYVLNKGTSAIQIPKEEKPVDLIIIVKFRNKYIPVNEIYSLQDYSGALCCCNLYTKKALKTICNNEPSDNNFKDLDAYVHTVMETFSGTGIERRSRIDNLKKISKEYKELIK